MISTTKPGANPLSVCALPTWKSCTFSTWSMCLFLPLIVFLFDRHSLQDKSLKMMRTEVLDRMKRCGITGCFSVTKEFWESPWLSPNSSHVDLFEHMPEITKLTIIENTTVPSVFVSPKIVDNGSDTEIRNL